LLPSAWREWKRGLKPRVCDRGGRKKLGSCQVLVRRRKKKPYFSLSLGEEGISDLGKKKGKLLNRA